MSKIIDFLNRSLDDEKKWKKCVDDLLAMRRLEQGWDGEDAIAPNPDFINKALDLVCSPSFRHLIKVAPKRVVPVNDGTIALDIYISNSYINIRITSKQTARIMMVNNQNKPQFYELSWIDYGQNDDRKFF